MRVKADGLGSGGGAESLTIGRVALAAGVGVETIRYYQGRGLLPVPKAARAFRLYPAKMVDRIFFIKRAQALGFSLDEVRTLLDLEDGRNRKAIQAVTQARLEQVERKVADLERMRTALTDLLRRCTETGHAHPCPIIATLAGSEPSG
ncbi:MAG: MerR family DNA-binding protein [Luteimonas sp.]|jgi:MerR family mercuric resistance operon transcriptional regulator|nr:MerR family DNA-binding protein [Luteimonas sp.]